MLVIPCLRLLFAVTGLAFHFADAYLIVFVAHLKEIVRAIRSRANTLTLFACRKLKLSVSAKF
jgi:hypothetical protein